MIDHSEQPECQVPAGSGRVARRHRVEGGRQRVVKFRFTDAEYEAVSARAAEAGVSVPRLDAALAAAGTTTRAMPAGQPAQGPDPPGRPGEPEPGQPGMFRIILPPQRNAPWMPG
jgi:hypothetical protein